MQISQVNITVLLLCYFSDLNKFSIGKFTQDYLYTLLKKVQYCSLICYSNSNNVAEARKIYSKYILRSSKLIFRLEDSDLKTYIFILAQISIFDYANPIYQNSKFWSPASLTLARLNNILYKRIWWNVQYLSVFFLHVSSVLVIGSFKNKWVHDLNKFTKLSDVIYG